jgi:hypothetical protein
VGLRDIRIAPGRAGEGLGGAAACRSSGVGCGLRPAAGCRASRLSGCPLGLPGLPPSGEGGSFTGAARSLTGDGCSLSDDGCAVTRDNCAPSPAGGSLWGALPSSIRAPRPRSSMPRPPGFSRCQTSHRNFMSSGRSGGAGSGGDRRSLGALAAGRCACGSGGCSANAGCTGVGSPTSASADGIGATSRARTIGGAGAGAGLAGNVAGSGRTAGPGTRARRVIAARRLGARAPAIVWSRCGTCGPEWAPMTPAAMWSMRRANFSARPTRPPDDALRETRSLTRGRPGCAPSSI